ncbi:Cyclic nucleotide-binding domain-containing protein [Desulfonema limicola]|uniref:Cyclic nucleotide-binding domain-containing protein n=1 Tax=Desulfonema limicola TaxID=45656 RepID=A0A975GHJ3_9BACT|nr:cyclic nucleotide-binding domain-containing protein [Desulfonema limicola]QTA81555.1 Cyclic nucleotide-binding domain-containing protein [Desulfonema limicola]
MSFPKAIVKVIGADECPLYKVEDEFKLSNQSLLAPGGKPACLILVRDITQVMIKYECIETDSRYVFDCSGCSGLVRLELKKEPETDLLSRINQIPGDDIYAIASSLSHFSFFQIFDEKSINDLISVLRLNKYNKDEIILSKGEPGKNLYIIVSGRVEVLAGENIRIAVLGKGEIFGEMSLLSGEPVGATVKAMTPVSLLYLNGQYFKEILYKSPSIQIYITRMLARRIADTNIVRSREFASSITGNLSEIPPSELFQTLHFNQKTGVLILQMSEGLAAASFREGKLIRAKYKDKEDKEAFFEILKAKEGRFKFNNGLPAEETRTQEIGNFMKLLIQGSRNEDAPGHIDT